MSATTPDSAEAVNVRIAELCGWQRMQRPLSDQEGEIPGHFETRWFHPKIHTSIYPLYALPKSPPNYSGSLDAMHEAIAALDEQELEEYACFLSQIVNGWKTRPWKYSECDVAAILKATAAQRAAAFLTAKTRTNT